MTGFDRFVMVDWSGGNDTGPRPRPDAIWVCSAMGREVEAPIYLRNRALAEAWLERAIEETIENGQTLCIGFDFPFGYPAGFARALTGTNDPLAVWRWLADRVTDTPKANNRFDVAAEVNRALGSGQGPFWGNGLKRDIAGLPRRKDGYLNPFPDMRRAERQAKGTFTCWQLAGAGAVGSQVIMGLPVLARLRQRFQSAIAVWPFETLDCPVAFVEIWPSLMANAVRSECARRPDAIKDAVQVELVARALSNLPVEDLSKLLDVAAPEEGWILGLGHEPQLSLRAKPKSLQPPPLRNDCFALPAGVEWIPAATALTQLEQGMSPVTEVERLPIGHALNRVLAEDLLANRSNPPHPNSAVDGYGFSGALPPGDHVLPLHPGRAAAGVPYEGAVPPGHALRILTGAVLPDGIDTVVLEEDVSKDDTSIALRGPVKQAANTRRAGEDVVQAGMALPKGRRIGPADLALAAVTGAVDVLVHRKLTVAVMSTGDELVAPGAPADRGQINDANRPMLLGLLAEMGFETVDIGIVPDNRPELQSALDRAAKEADAILTSGGASAGEEDHVSALLNEAGAMQQWRIAVKPGRPLGLGLWNNAPVFGLPGNPVAAFVCTLVFAAPALRRLAGQSWSLPEGVMVPAAFEKRKKVGRREYLRARIRDGRAEVFGSEGSGRISGLSWADGLVELPDAAVEIKKGDLVRYVPYASFLTGT